MFTTKRPHRTIACALAVASAVATLSPGTPAAEAAPNTRAPMAATAASPSGEEMPVGDLPGWHQVFTDDFTTNVAARAASRPR